MDQSAMSAALNALPTICFRIAGKLQASSVHLFVDANGDTAKEEPGGMR